MTNTLTHLHIYTFILHHFHFFSFFVFIYFALIAWFLNHLLKTFLSLFSDAKVLSFCKLKLSIPRE